MAKLVGKNEKNEKNLSFKMLQKLVLDDVGKNHTYLKGYYWSVLLGCGVF